MMMFQPVGGMDRIPYAFAKAIGAGSKIRLRRRGHRITNTAGGVAGRLPRPARRDPGGHGRLRRLHAAAAHRSRRSRTTCGRRRRGASHYARPDDRRQDRPRVPPPLVGGGRADLRRHHQHQPRPVNDLVPVLRATTASAALVVGYYNFGANADCLRRADAGRAARARASTQGTKIHGDVYAQRAASSFSVAWHADRYIEGALGRLAVPDERRVRRLLEARPATSTSPATT